MTPQERLDRIEGLIEKQSADIDKQNAGIRDLVVVSRTVLTTIQEMGNQHQEIAERHDKDHQQMLSEIEKLRAAQAETDEKLNILVDTVDRIIRNWNQNNNN